MRLFICLLVLSLSGLSRQQECAIVDIRDAYSINLEASANTTGVEARRIDKVTVSADNPEAFGDECAEVCCQNVDCNIAEVSFEEEEDTCQLIRCVPVEKCVWQDNPDTISIIIQMQQATSSGSTASTVAAAVSASPSGTSKTENTIVKNQSSMVPTTQPATQRMTPQTAAPTYMQASTSQTSSNNGQGQNATHSTTQGQATTNHSSLSTAPTTTQQKQSALPTNSTASTMQANSTIPQQAMASQSATQTAKATAVATNSTTHNQTASIASSSTTPVANTTAATQTVKSTALKMTNTTRPTNITAIPILGPGPDDKLSPYSLAAIFGTSITVSLLVVFIVSHRFYESWKRRHYKQVDYLIDGLYE